MDYEGLKDSIVELIVKKLATEPVDLGQLIKDVKIEVSLIAVAMCEGVVDRGSIIIRDSRTAVSERIRTPHGITQEYIKAKCEKLGVPFHERKVPHKKDKQQGEERLPSNVRYL